MIRRLATLVTLVVLGICGTGPSARAAEPVKVGILGIDNFGSVAYTEFLNHPKAEGDLAGIRVVAALEVNSPTYPDSAKLAGMWKQQLLTMYQNPKDPKDKVPPVEFVNSMDELFKKCDTVMIFAMDGTQHLELAKAALKAGKRLFISRPVASSPEDAVAIYKLSEELKVPVWSSSQHRFSTGFSGMRNHPEVGKVIGCDVYGGWTENSPPADKFMRPLHSIETLYAIMGPGVTTVSCVSTPTAESITAVWKDGRVGTYRGIKEGAVKYSATVFGDKGVSTAGIYGHGIPVKGVVPTTDKYVGYEGLAIQIAKFLKGGPVPVTPAETLEIFAVIKAAEESKAKGGAATPLPDLAAGLKK